MKKISMALMVSLIAISFQCANSDKTENSFSKRIFFYTHSDDYSTYTLDVLEQGSDGSFSVKTGLITVNASSGLKSVMEYNNYLYIVDSSSTGKLLVYDRTTLSQVKALDISGNYPQEMVIANGKAFIGITGNFGSPDNKVKVINLDNPADPVVSTTLIVGNNPTALRLLNGKINVSNIDNVNKTQSTIQIIDPSDNSVSTAINSGENPSDLAYDSSRVWSYNSKWFGGTSASLTYVTGTTPTQINAFPAGYSPAYGGSIAFNSSQGYLLLDNGSSVFHLFSISGTTVNTTPADAVNKYKYVGTGANHLFKAHNGDGTTSNISVVIENLNGVAVGNAQLTKYNDMGFWPAR